MPDELRVEPLPHVVHYLWEWFLELHRSRSGSGFGPNPIGFVEIDAWQRVTGRNLSGWEVDVMFALDGAFLTSIPLPKSGDD